MRDFISDGAEQRTLVRAEDAATLMSALSGQSAAVTTLDAETFEVVGVSPRDIGRRALRPAVVLHELSPQHSTLEDSYMRLTGDHVEYRSGGSMTHRTARGVAEPVRPFAPDPDLPGVTFAYAFIAEVRKLLALRTAWWLIGIAVGLSVLLAGAVA